MKRQELIQKYLEFFKSKSHKIIANSSLIPENDPTALFTTAGMHPLVPYLLGQQHSQGKRLADVQRCIRTTDIEEVGNTRHHTFFEMLGNWSLGDYFKKEAIEFSYELATKILGLKKERLAVTVFSGNKNSPKDNESAKIWGLLGIPKERIVFLKDNWWELPGAGPCGPDTEMFYWSPKDIPAPKKFDPEDERWVEIWNDVLMQYTKDEKGNYKIAAQKNIDNGRGLERVLAVTNGFDDNYMTEIWQPMIKKIETISKRKYDLDKETQKAMRIIADHIKSSVFIIADGVTPSNTERGYVLRRLIRRAIRYGRLIGLQDFTKEVAKPVLEIYPDYVHLEKNKAKIFEELEKEEEKFNQTLEKGLNKLNKLAQEKKEIDCKNAFLLYQSFGFPIEMTIELAKEKGIKVDEKGFERECLKHQELSRTATAGKFKSGLADNSEATTCLHTSAHLLLESLRKVLKDENIIQKGSNITPERLRLDFSFPRRLTAEEIEEVEKLVNKEIQKKQKVLREEMSPQEAKKKGALGIFDNKYGEKVSVYTIGDFSKEICAGPHVENTSELGKFKITKEESVSSGVRRIKAILE